MLLVIEFSPLQSLHSPTKVAISLDEVVEHFSKTTQSKRKLDLEVDEAPNKKSKKKNQKEDNDAKKKGNNTPFRRVVSETIEVNPNLTDNSANTSFDTWGARVSNTTRILIVIFIVSFEF